MESSSDGIFLIFRIIFLQLLFYIIQITRFYALSMSYSLTHINNRKTPDIQLSISKSCDSPIM